jgi:hypothetical protein
VLANGIEATSTTGGTGALTLSDVSNRPNFDDVFGSSGTRLVSYAINEDANGKYEWGIGTLTLSTLSLARTKIKATFTGGTYDNTNPSAVSFGTSGVTIWCAPLADDFVPSIPFVTVASPADDMGIPSAHLWVNSNLAVTLNLEYYVPFLWLGQGDVVQAAIRVTTGVASSNGKVALYEMLSTGLPGVQLADFGVLSTVTSASNVATTASPLPLNLPVGWYYAGFVFSHGPSIRGHTGNGTATPAGTSAGNPITGFTKAGSYASGLPGPASTGLTALTGAPAPALYLKPRNT